MMIMIKKYKYLNIKHYLQFIKINTIQLLNNVIVNLNIMI